MPSTLKRINGLLVIPYGSQGVRKEVLDHLRAGQSDDLERPGAPVVVVDPSLQLPLRMHDLVHPFTLPPIAQDLAHAQTQLAFLQQHLSRLCGDWARSSQAFIACYFEQLRAVVRENEQALLDRTGALSGLVEIDHWCFAACMPLPRAHLYLPDCGQADDYQPADFIAVDFAFWSGTELIAVVIDNGNTPTGARKKALGRLAANDINLQSIGLGVLHSDQPHALLNALGPAFESFWSDLPIPSSPFRGRGIDRPVSAGCRNGLETRA
jgi:hypothetical protein